ncbi:hypothetical protein N865_20105 [Intrasporangium oryzae NRRL B-24470]|uniref:N-formylglutamate amidohydrolase n=1 Tax=Intrasporangium oryzae NRRL B-24470 TaxID=1386089 RepID=W9G3J1_9MICO|nr:N-formylglutamate amidohydrolase [Intrasporangium oryzae]EWS99876.1 hypothetical protein N865_20105 [Intrasporangium oryzae NRRL B-24470]
MTESDPLLLPPQRAFTPEEITHWADRDRRGLDEALATADVLVSCPHAGAAIPGELAPYLDERLTRRLQFDFTDVSTAAVAARWAEIDPTVVIVINPHPRLVRDPNRPRPEDPAARLREALARVREAGPFQRVDLKGCDAIRPVTFSFTPILRVPEDEQGVERLVADFMAAGACGVDVYQQTRVDLLERMITLTHERAASGRRAILTTLSFHDTMNTTTSLDGAVDVARAPADELPRVVALSNRGDAEGELRDPADRVTMDAERLRRLAAAHRDGFAVADPADVALNRPYLGSEEILSAGRRFRDEAARAAESGARFDAVQAEFLREFLLGPAAVAQIRRPGTTWPDPDPAQVDDLAHRLRDTWAGYRAMVT